MIPTVIAPHPLIPSPQAGRGWGSSGLISNQADMISDAKKREPNAENSEIDAGSEEMRASYKASISGRNQSEQGFQKPSRTAQEHLTNSSNEFVRCISDTLNEILQVEETAHAPLGGASPQSVESVEELEKDLPTAMDCTTLVEAAPSQSTSLLAENQNCGVEPRDCHVRAASRREGTCSAAPVVQNEFCLSSAIAEQTQEQVEQGYSALLMVENSVSGVETKADHEGESSAAPVVNPEKWSYEAIVARSNMRETHALRRIQGRIRGLTFCSRAGVTIPRKQIAIKKLLAKFPQWGIACVYGVLVKWN